MLRWYVSLIILLFLMPDVSSQTSVGIYTTNEINNDGILCQNESFIIQPLVGQVMPTNLNDPLIPYQPGIGIAVFSCVPTYTNNNPMGDPCFIGIIASQPQSANYNPFVIENNTSFWSQLPPPFNLGPSIPTTIYVQMITLYNFNTNAAYSNLSGPNFDCANGTTNAITIEPSLVVATNENCITGQITVSITEGNPIQNPFSFVISNGFPVSASFSNSCNNGGSFTIANLNNGDLVGFQVSNNDGCVYNHNVNFVGAVSASIIAPSSVCENDPPFLLNASPANGVWSGASCLNNTTGEFNPSLIDISTPTTYQIQYTPTTGSPGCNIAQTVNITVNPTIESTISDPGLICPNDASLMLTGATPNGVWSGQSNVININGIFNPQTAGPGTHTIVYSIPGTCGSSSSIDITVQNSPVISFSASANTGCTPLEVDFQNTTNGGGSNFKWFINQNAINETSDLLTYTFPNSQCYDIGLALTDLNGCRDTLDSIQLICPHVNPWIDFIQEPEDPTIDQPVVYFSSTNEGLVNCTWDFAGEANGNGFITYHSFQSIVPGEFQVCLTGIDTNGCSNTGCQYVSLLSAFQVFAPTAFTPGDDGRNDAFKPVIVSPREVKKYELRIFNRWGKEVFFTDDSNQYWYGNTDDGEYYTRDDVYDWVLRVTLFGLEDTRIFNGTVVMVR
jgi:gliding motility-associated-like protein